MTQIVDVGPNSSNTSTPDIGHSVIGRMLSIACSPDGGAVYAGSYSNIWASFDGGQNFGQLTWPQPATGQFDVPGSLGGWCVVDMAVALGWRVDKHPRFLARLTQSGHEDIVGFGDCGVWTALGNGDGTFQYPRVVIDNFGYQAGGWRVDMHPRFVVDLNNDGCADIVGFGNAGVYTALGNGDGTFQAPRFVLGNYGVQQDWQVDKHPRFLAVLTGSGFADIVGFGEDGVWTALGNGDGTFSEPNKNPVLANFCYKQGWRVDEHPRLLANLTDSGYADIVGFGPHGVWTALGNGDGTFQKAKFVLENFGVDQGWQVDKHVRMLGVLTSSEYPGIVGFGDPGVFTAIGNGDGSFQNARLVLENFAVDQGWQVDEHPRFLAALTNSGYDDIVGFGYAGVWTATGKGDGTFNDAKYVLANFGLEQGWQVDMHPRFVTPLKRRGFGEIVGFGDAGVWSAIGDGQGGFPASNFVLANFGYGSTVLALTVNDRAAGSRGIWRSPDGGSTWTKVHQFPTSGEAVGQLQWALGSDHLVYAAGGSSLAISKNAGATFVDVFPWGTGPAAQVNHVAVWQNAPSDSAPAVIYALGNSTMFVSVDGGVTWMKDKATSPPFPPNSGGAVSSTVNSNSPNVMVISPRFPLEVFLAQNGTGAATGAVLYRGDYSQFPFGTQTSSWDVVPLPSTLRDPSTQDSGNVFLVTTQKGRGDLLFYGAQRWFDNFSQAIAWVGPLYPVSGSDWKQLGAVHVDLHGFLLSPDFAATIENGTYQGVSGTSWILSDGGIYWSTDGGTSFQAANNAMTLSCVNVAGVSTQSNGPALSLNTGDNDGFYSMDGGASWSYQQYGGGDNDCSFADPLRSNSMLVFTPRWNHTVSIYETSPGSLPNAAAIGTSTRYNVPGPTTPNVWNANSAYGNRGSRPIVHGLAGEVAPAEGDYIFILNPTSAQPQLVRTQNIQDIASGDEWVTTATAPGQGANVYLQGPPLPSPNQVVVQQNPSLGVVQASGGYAATVLYVGGDSTLWVWTEGAAQWKNLVPGKIVQGPKKASFAFRFFVDPCRPKLIYILDADHVKRSDDGGATWVVDQLLETQLTWGNQIAISTNDTSSGIGDYFDMILTDMKFDPNNPLVRFAVGEGGAFYTNDGVNWTTLLHAGAMAGRPANCYYDWITDPSDPALYVAFAGRSLVKISQLPASTIV